MPLIPRLLLAAPSSGSGKTTFCCALLRALQLRGFTPAAFKTGPDYIDPMFHETVLGIKGYNLDLFFSTPKEVRSLLVKGCSNASIAVLEGAMGYYDGIAGKTSDASAWQVAVETKTPALLILRPQGSSLTLAAQVQGLLHFRNPHQFAAICLNDCKPSLFALLKPLLEEQTGLPVIGYLPPMPDAAFQSRHLGLVLPGELPKLQESIDRLAHQLLELVDLDHLLEIAASAPPLEEESSFPKPSRQIRIAYAKDPAFCFYYRENLEILKTYGAVLIPFSPLNDPALPEDVSALYLGGGYPELYAKKLSENRSMRTSIKEAHRRKMPILAECGGFQYLQKYMTDDQGIRYPMVGLIDAESVNVHKLSHFGYITLQAIKDTMLCAKGDTIRAHEFHYWQSTQTPSAFWAQKPQSSRGWEAIVAEDRLFAGYPHLYFPSNPLFAARFVDAAERYAYESSRTGTKTFDDSATG